MDLSDARPEGCVSRCEEVGKLQRRLDRVEDPEGPLCI